VRCIIDAAPAACPSLLKLRGDPISAVIRSDIFIDVPGADRGQLFELVHPLRNVHPRPRAPIESSPCGSYGCVDILGAGHLDMADGPFGVRGYNRELLASGGFAPVPFDEQFVI
jgi:hypothetical protein